MFYRNGVTLIRVSKSLLNGFSKRLQHVQPEPKKPFYKRWFDYITIYGIEGQSAAYNSIVVSRFHRVDKIDSSKWKIIYHDFVASRIGIIGVVTVACVSAGIAFFSGDFYVNGKFTTPMGIRWQKDFEELGYFSYVIGSAMILCATCLIRLNLLRVLRIYQSKSNPEEFIMMRAGILRFYKKTPFTRSEVKVLPLLYDQNALYYQLFTYGNINIKNKPAIINTDSFQEPVIKSFMFGERNTMPEKLLPSNSKPAAKSKKIPPPPMF